MTLAAAHSDAFRCLACALSLFACRFGMRARVRVRAPPSAPPFFLFFFKKKKEREARTNKMPVVFDVGLEGAGIEEVTTLLNLLDGGRGTRDRNRFRVTLSSRSVDTPAPQAPAAAAPVPQAPAVAPAVAPVAQAPAAPAADDGNNANVVGQFLANRVWAAKDDDDLTCSICLDAIRIFSEFKLLKCGHHFHAHCLQRNLNTSCAMCRAR